MARPAFANRQHADLASAFTEAWDRDDHSRATIRTSLATYDDGFQNSLQTELAKGVKELGSNPANYDLADKPDDAPHAQPKIAADCEPFVPVRAVAARLIEWP